MIKYNSVTKIYNSKKSNVTALDNASFSVDKSSIVGLLGPSGCGKTTLLKLTNKLIKLTKGSIIINEKDIMITKMLSLDKI